MTPARSLPTDASSTNPIIDLDAEPFVPKGWKVEEHQKGGQFKWDASQVALYLSEQQKRGEMIWGSELHKELASKPVCNANALDYLLANPHLIPEEWKGKYIFFWGTVYRYSDVYLCVRCLYRYGGRWDWGDRWLGRDWTDILPATVPVN